jgi:hypothetical protein
VFIAGDFIWYSEQPLGSFKPAPDRTSHDGGEPEGAAAGAAPRVRPVAVLLPPDKRQLPCGLPSHDYGSDHVCLMSVFELGGPEELR